MALTAQQQVAREGKLTASRVSILMNGDDAKVLNLWRELVGDPAFVPEDLSDVWAVQLGIATEALHLDWYEKQTARKLADRGKVVVSDKAPWASATLDAFDTEINAPVEVKHVNAFSKMREVVARYMPQLHWQMICADCTASVLSVIVGAAEPQQTPVAFDTEYGSELWGRAVSFWKCVENLTPPVTLAPVVAPVPAEQWIEADMSSSNSWVNYAADWIANQTQAKTHETASKELKALVEKNVGFAYGAGIEIKRSKAGSLTIKETKS